MKGQIMELLKTYSAFNSCRAAKYDIPCLSTDSRIRHAMKDTQVYQI